MSIDERLTGLRDAGPPGDDRQLDVDAALERTRARRRQRRRARRLVAAAAIVVVAGVGAIVGVAARDNGAGTDVATGPRDRTVPGEGPGVFSEPTETVLLFSGAGVMAVDLDQSIVGRRRVEGGGASEVAHLILTDGHLIGGSLEIHAAPLDGGPSRLIDVATIPIPASEPGQVWTLDYAGGRIGQGQLTLRRVDLDGNVHVSTDAFQPGGTVNVPLIGVPDGLAVRTRDGVAIYDPDTDRFGPTLGPGAPLGAVTNGRQLIWCATADCGRVLTADLPETGEPTPPHAAAGSHTPVLAPDGNRVAVVDRSGVGRRPEAPPTLVVVDLATGERTVAAALEEGLTNLAWSPDGSQVFAAEYSWGSDETRVGRYDVEAETWEIATVPAGGTVNFIAIDPDRASSFFPDSFTDPSECQPSTHYPSGRTTCGYRF